MLSEFERHYFRYRGVDGDTMSSRLSKLLSLLMASFLFLCLPLVQATAQSNQSSPLGTNLGGVTYYTSEQPFLNIFKTGNAWSGNVTNGTHYDQFQGVFQLDANGYPTSMNGIGPAAGQTFTQIGALFLRSLGIASPDGSESAPFYPAGNYVFLYDGTGTFAFNFDTNNSNIVSSAPGRIVVNVATPSAGGILIGITSTGSGTNYARNFRFVYSPDSTASVIGVRESLLNNGEIFNPDFINRISQFKTLRFMDWASTNTSTLANWADRPLPSWAFWGGGVVPAEIMVALCNKISSDGWFNMPTLATDDFVTQYATLVHSTLNSNLKAYVEYGNEIWNNGALATFNNLVTLGWAAFPGSASNWAAAFNYAILRAVQNGATWKSVWGPDAGRVIRVAAGQNGYTARNQYILGFTAGMYGGNPSNFSGTVAQNVEVFATAPYFGYAVPDTFTLDQLFTEIMSGGALTGGYPGGMIKQALDYAASDYSVAKAAGIPLVAYEGGQTFVDYSGSDIALQKLYTAANRDPRMGTAYTTYLNGWKNLGGTLFNNFTDIITNSKWGYWGGLENVLQTSSPKYDALINFISANPCWWNGCSSTSAPAASPSTSTPTSTVDTTPPSVPAGLTGNVASSTQVNLSWTASTDNVGVAGYNVFRNGTKVGTTSNTSYQDSGLSAGNAYTYSVSAYDAAGNTSAESSSLSVTTPAPPSVAINSPGNGSVVNGSANIAVSAASASGIASITITADGNQLATCANVSSCSTTWQKKKIPVGTHMISGIATDVTGNQANTSITIVVLR